MVKLPPFLVVHRFPNFKLKFKLGALLLCLSVFLNYQPSLGFPPVKTSVVFAEATQEQSVTAETSNVAFQLPHPGYITTTFSGYHPGIDLCSGLGTPIKPIAKGTVVETGYNFFGLGLVVEVEHEGGYRSLYAHMGKIYVQKGQVVDAGDFVGEVGMTGHTSGPHTHLEVSKDGKKIDPRLILPEIRKYPTEEDFVAQTSSTPSAVLVPSATPIATSSAQVTKEVFNPIPQEIKTIEKEANLAPKAEEVKTETDFKKQSLNQILNLSNPKPLPSVAPVPQGGPQAFKYFSLFGLKK
jgi:hypothetical protein